MKRMRSKMSPRRIEPRALAPNVARVAGRGGSGGLSIRTVELTADLEPGDSAAAKFIDRFTDAGGGGDRLEAGTQTLTVYDSHSWSFGLSGYWLSVVNMFGRWETLPGQNVSNIKAKVKTGVTLSIGGSGLVEIWDEGSASGLEVTAYNTWIDADAIAAGTEILIAWKFGEQKWIVTDNECA